MNTSTENPYAGQGPVLLDIGGDVGALVVQMPAAMDGVEVELRPAGATARQTLGVPTQHPHDVHDDGHDDAHHHDHDDDGHDDAHHHDHDDDGHLPAERAGAGPAHYPHVAVVARPVGSVLRHSLVYPDVVEGEYELFRLPAGPVALTVQVLGGAVATAIWPETRAG